MDKLYQLENIKLSYLVYNPETSAKENVEALSGIDLDIYQNQFVGIVGENGSGKSTLGKLLAGLAGKYTGKLIYNGKLVDQYSRDTFSDVGMVIQEPQNQLLMPTVIKELTYPLQNRGVGESDIEWKVDHYSKMFGLTDLLEKSPDQLSGGQTTSLALASILITDPNVVILDEPDSHFDSKSQEVLRDFIDEYKGRKTIILITQYINQVDTADEVYLLDKGRIVDNTESLNTASMQPDKASLIAGELSSSSHSNLDSKIELIDISFSFDDDVKALDSVNLVFNDCENIGIVGEMGSGKTTLGLIMAGLIKPTSGMVRLEGRSLIEFSDTKLRRKVSYSMQFPERGLFEETVLKDVSYGPSNLKLSELDKTVQKQLEKFGIDRLKHRHPFTLSGGEKRRAALAGIFAMDTDIIILDEPSAALDRIAIADLNLYLQTLIGKTIIIISHDKEFIASNCNRVIELKRGRVISDKPVSQF